MSFNIVSSILVLLASTVLLEIAVNTGSATERFKAKLGDFIVIEKITNP